MTLQDAKQGWEFLFLPEKYGIKAKVWNPITGCPKLAEGKPCACPDGTPYCYMDSLIKRFPKVHSAEYKFHPDRIDQIKYSKPSLIGVGTSGDMWGWNDGDQSIAKAIFTILTYMFRNNHHFYLFLTKFPENYVPYNFSAWSDHHINNIGIGTTVTRPDELHRIETLKKVEAPMRYVVFEPLFGDWRDVDLSVLEGIDWVILGSVTGQPHKEWIQDGSHYMPWLVHPPAYCIQPLIYKLEELKIPTFMKRNFEFVPVKILKEFPLQILEWAEKARVK